MKLAMLAVIAGLGAATVPNLAGAANMPGAGDRCFQTNKIRGQKIVDSKTLYFKVADGGIFRVETANTCLSGARFNDPLVIKSVSGSTRICRPVDLDLGVREAVGGTTPCLVSRIVRLTPEEAAALPRKERP